LFSYKLISSSYKVQTIIQLSFFFYDFSVFDIIFLSVFYFNTWLIFLLLILFATLFLAIAFQQLEKTYHWFERQLVKNIARKSARHAKYAELAPWDTHLVDLVVDAQAHLVHKSLKQCQIRQTYDINIVAIARNNHIILAPRGDELLLPQDQLIVLGNDEQIERFKSQIESVQTEQITDDLLANFTLRSLLIEHGNPLCGKTIRTSQIREQIHGMVVGLERNGKQILNPAPELVLENGDLLLIVLETQYLTKLHELLHSHKTA
ncbi:MAG: TrkA C-terminal domain-containing protein, partial [Gammaproteobacteria bacterium]